MDYAEVLRTLTAKGARFAVAGGFACLAHGVVRVTMDLDLLIELQDENLARLWDALVGLGFTPQQPISRAEGISAVSVRRLSEAKGMQALSWVHGSQPFIIVDLLVGPEFHWSEDLFEPANLFGVICPVVRREELIRLKRRAGRPKDLVDVGELEKLG